MRVLNRNINFNFEKMPRLINSTIEGIYDEKFLYGAHVFFVCLFVFLFQKNVGVLLE